MRTYISLLLASSLLLTAYTPEDDKEDPGEPLTDGKVDSTSTDFVFSGALVPDASLSAELTATSRYLGFTFYARGGDHVSLALASTKNVDTVLYVYGPYHDRTWGGRSLAVNDDFGGSRLSRIDNLALPGDGQYLALVMAYKNRTKGPFTISLACPGGCSTEPRSGDVVIQEIHALPDPVNGDANRDGTIDADG